MLRRLKFFKRFNINFLLNNFTILSSYYEDIPIDLIYVQLPAFKAKEILSRLKNLKTPQALLRQPTFQLSTEINHQFTSTLQTN